MMLAWEALQQGSLTKFSSGGCTWHLTVLTAKGRQGQLRCQGTEYFLPHPSSWADPHLHLSTVTRSGCWHV